MQQGLGRPKRVWQGLAAALVLLFWPREAILGTYGSFTLVRRGYTIAKAINIGSHSDHEREGELFRSRETELAAQVKPQLNQYDSFYARILTQPHPYAGWLAALDNGRTTAQQWDYKWRLPGPVVQAPKSELGPLSGFGPGDAPQVYLHMKPAAAHLLRGRALVGFALAQAFLGDGADFALGRGETGPLGPRVQHAAHADSFWGQSAVVATLVLAVRARQPELAMLADDATQPADVRLLAGLVRLGLRHEAWTAADWQRLDAAKSAGDRRTLWTWVLLFTPAEEQPQREDELRKRLPLSDSDIGYFYREFVQGSKD